jgi:type I restriction enzyme S subunit
VVRERLDTYQDDRPGECLIMPAITDSHKLAKTDAPSRDLPDGWVSAKVSEGTVSVQPGFACGVNNRGGEGVAQLRPMNINRDGRIVLTDLKFVPPGEMTSDDRWVRQGDVVFNNTNSPQLVGKTAYYDQLEPRAFSNHMTRIRCRADVLDPRYCAMVLHQLWRQGYFESVCNNHVSQASVGRSMLMSTVIPLPPAAEQQRIVEKVDMLLAGVNAARERLAQVPGIMKRFRQSILEAACSGRLTEDWRAEHPSSRVLGLADEVMIPDEALPPLPDLPNDWQAVIVGAIAGPIQYGVSAKGETKPTVGIPILRMGNIQDGRIDLASLQYVPDSPAYSNFLLQPGDLLFNRTNSPELVGKAAVYDVEARAVFASYLVRVQCDPNKMMSTFLCYWINSPWGHEWARSVKTDGVSQSNINATKLGKMPVPQPPLAEQKEIVRRVESLFQRAADIEHRVSIATISSERLTQSILEKAFLGELVPTEAELARRENRDYEPAWVLLRRSQS